MLPFHDGTSCTCVTSSWLVQVRPKTTAIVSPIFIEKRRRSLSAARACARRMSIRESSPGCICTLYSRPVLLAGNARMPLNGAVYTVVQRGIRRWAPPSFIARLLGVVNTAHASKPVPYPTGDPRERQGACSRCARAAAHSLQCPSPRTHTHGRRIMATTRTSGTVSPTHRLPTFGTRTLQCTP